MRPTLSWLVLLTAVALASPSTAREIFIEADGSGDYETVQDAILVAQPGDEIVVGPGTYSWTSQHPWTYEFGMGGIGSDFGMWIFWVGDTRDITIRSSHGAAATIIDAENQGRHIFTNNSALADVNFTIDGFTFRRARRTQEDETEGGGSIFHLVRPTIRNCVFEDNEAYRGAALFFPNARDALVENCRFVRGTSEIGAAIAAINGSGTVVVRDCVFEDNTSTSIGGAIVSDNQAMEIYDCLFLNNHADNRGSAILGWLTKPLIISGCWMEGNSSPGAVVAVEWFEYNNLPNAEAEIHNTAIMYNQASGLQMTQRVNMAVTCTNVYRNRLGENWVALTAAFLGADGNISTNPLRCEDDPDRFAVQADSPMLAANIAECDANISFAMAACEGEEPPPPTEGPDAFVMKAAYPNPFRPGEDGITLEYDLPSAQTVSIDIYSITGKHVRSLTAGTDRAVWDGLDTSGSPVASGVYVARARSGEQSARRRLVVLR